MKLYERLLDSIEDNEITDEFQELFEEFEENDEISLIDVLELCRVFNDEVDDYGLYYSIIHRMETIYEDDKEGYIKAVVNGLDSNTQCCRGWASNILNRLINAGHESTINTLLKSTTSSNLEDLKK